MLYFGQTLDLSQIKKYNVNDVKGGGEDACQSVGSRTREAKLTGSSVDRNLCARIPEDTADIKEGDRESPSKLRDLSASGCAN